MKAAGTETRQPTRMVDELNVDVVADAIHEAKHDYETWEHTATWHGTLGGLLAEVSRVTEGRACYDRCGRGAVSIWEDDDASVQRWAILFRLV